MSVAADLPGPPERKLTPRGEDRRQELLDYATRRFAENGFHPTSVSDIVDGIGVGKGVFYWYFPSKDELLLEILRTSLYSLRRTQREAIGAEADPLVRLELGIRASLLWYRENPDTLRVTMFCWTEELFASALRKGRRVSVADTARHVTDAIELGLIPDGDVNLMATAILGIIDELGRSAILGSKKIDEEMIEFAVSMCLSGIRGPR